MGVHGKIIAVLGGDRRMTEAVRFFQQAGMQARLVGLPPGNGLVGMHLCDTAAEALSGADLAVLPVQGVAENGKIFTQPGIPELQIDLQGLRCLRTGSTVFTGLASEYLRSICQQASMSLYEYREADEFAIWNSIPSAEGGIQMAMEATPFTIFGSRSLVLGFGRTGKALALLLRGLCSQVTIAIREALDAARVWASGYGHVEWNRLKEAVVETDLIFNTVPALVLTREILASAPKHAVVIDMASAPGGTDFEAAGELGITALLAPGLPGIVAPVTAGRIIAEMILRYLGSTRGEENR